MMCRSDARERPLPGDSDETERAKATSVVKTEGAFSSQAGQAFPLQIGRCGASFGSLHLERG